MKECVWNGKLGDALPKPADVCRSKNRIDKRLTGSAKALFHFYFQIGFVPFLRDQGL